MAARSRKNIQTNSGVFIVNPTALRKSGIGSVELTSGASGSVNGITVDSVQIMSGAVSFNTSLAQTANDVADNINAFAYSSGYSSANPKYFAVVPTGTALINIMQVTPLAGTLTVASSVTTIGKTDTNLSGGQAGSGGYQLGYTETGFEIDYNDQYVDDLSEEGGRNTIQLWYVGGTAKINVMFKQWDQDVLEARFPGRFNATNMAVEFPGTITPGTSMVGTEPVILEFRPDNMMNSSLLAFKATLSGQMNVASRFRTTESKKLAVQFTLMEDETITSGARLNYRNFFLGLSAKMSLT